MSKRRVLSFKPQLRLEWRGQDGQKETEQSDHSASLGDSITSSTRIRFSVHTGTVKWFNGQKGYGFIAPDTGGKDVFVHISAVEKAGLDGLPDGAKVTFDIVPNRGKESAENLRVK